MLKTTPRIYKKVTGKQCLPVSGPFLVPQRSLAHRARSWCLKGSFLPHSHRVLEEQIANKPRICSSHAAHLLKPRRARVKATPRIGRAKAQERPTITNKKTTRMTGHNCKHKKVRRPNHRWKSTSIITAGGTRPQASSIPQIKNLPWP